LDVEAIRRLAPDSTLPAEDLVFLPGISTRSETNHLAGRGVGLDSVRADLERIGYRVSVETARGLFTRFTVDSGLHPSPDRSPEA
ncbi:MAG: hybrid sensor histidine kinase/response regulator, partial [Myxococcota bacterium]|nr:hybrid sensor histidine kinase/response regulator [Myxococcota bacterium]